MLATGIIRLCYDRKLIPLDKSKEPHHVMVWNEDGHCLGRFRVSNDLENILQSYPDCEFQLLTQRELEGVSWKSGS